MRTLIIDNYDSFTYNLFHYIAGINGVEPTVVRNDDPGWTGSELDFFDNVVISPGPGRPDRPSDLGICAEVIRTSRLPLLGVCLGHQGLCHLSGAGIQPAPELYHGRTSPVVHRGADILAGVPSPFSAVRYHSMIVTGLPGNLEAIGWTPEGVVMAVRDRRRPAWGVQFHPESICTEYGHRILANFSALTLRLQCESGGRRRIRRRAGSEALPAPWAGAARDVRRRRALRVLSVPVCAAVDAEAVFDALYARSEYAFWLDSSLTGESGGRFSFMGDASGPLARVVRADVWAGQLTIDSCRGRSVVAASLFDWLEADLAACDVGIPDLPFGFTLGWAGDLGYELKAECGADRAHRSPHPDAIMIFADRAVAFDHQGAEIHLLALAENGDDRPARQWLGRVAALLATLAGSGAAPPGGCGRKVGQLRLRHDRRQYLQRIAACHERIAEGDSYEICLTNMMTADGDIDVWDAYRLLRRSNPVPFAALLRLGGIAVLSCSPERFLHVSADGLVESKPIKGTRPRSRSIAEDERLLRDLMASVKDRAENLMIVDLVRHDLGRVAVIGSVDVGDLFRVESYSTVHQLVSIVRARLRSGSSAVACARAAFPGGSMTGAPKVRTMQIIDQLESGPRGVYSGALGYFSLSGAADLSIVIRTLLVAAGSISFGVGGAITALSDPDAEYEEAAVKATPLLRLLGREFPERDASPSGSMVSRS